MKTRAIKRPTNRQKIVFGVAITLGIMLIAVLFRHVAPPTAAEYSAALQQVEQSKRALQLLEQRSSAYVEAIAASLRLRPDGSTVSKETADPKEQYEAALNELTHSVEQLAGMKAVRANELKRAVQHVQMSTNEQRTAVSALVNDYPVVIAVSRECASQQISSLPGDCRSALKSLQKARSPKLREFAGQQPKQNNQTTSIATQLQARVIALRESLFDTSPLNKLQKMLETKRAAA